MIDLHLHTTASDGLHTPAQLVALVKASGITVMGVADHDSMASVSELQILAREAGLGFVAGVEITAVWLEHDVHLLAYFVDPKSSPLSAFLCDQRADRERRARLIGERLAALGMPIDIEPLVADRRGKAVARPALARVLVEAGYVPSVQDAFDRYLGDDKPAWVRRCGATPAEVVALVNAEGGAVSMAHPGITRRDELIPDLARSGLAALEVIHTDHTPDDVARYRALIRNYGLGATGGSDFHGLGTHHADLGRVSLSADDFHDFCRRAGRPLPDQAGT